MVSRVTIVVLNQPVCSRFSDVELSKKIGFPLMKASGVPFRSGGYMLPEGTMKKSYCWIIDDNWVEDMSKVLKKWTHDDLDVSAQIWQEVSKTITDTHCGYERVSYHQYSECVLKI